MIVFGGVDGTGDANNDQYHRDMANSFVKRLYMQWPYPNLRSYHRGPELAGSNTANYGRKVYDDIIHCVDNLGAQAIVLSGYSRGGAAAIFIADLLKKRKLEVECMILFDAVDRSWTTGKTLNSAYVPSNVKYVIHATRDYKTLSRESFGNCGPLKNEIGKVAHKTFFATHGGMGGAPWKKPANQQSELVMEGWGDGYTLVLFEQDRVASRQVWSWVQGQFKPRLAACQQRLKAPTRAMPVGSRIGRSPTR